MSASKVYKLTPEHLLQRCAYWSS